MRRRHLIELHEQSWYPKVWRDLFQRGLGQAHTLTNAFENFYAPFGRFLERLQPASILDLCSGSGDAACITWRGIASGLELQDKPVLVLSDLFPNTESYRALKREYPNLIDYFPEPVDALRPPPEAPRIRTLFNCLHHFRPHQVQAILRDAVENADGIAVFEVTGRTWKNMLQTLFILPFAASFLTAFILRPFRLRNVLWGILIPIIPITAVFDGLVSNLRTFTVAELKEFTESVGSSEFDWEVGTAYMSRAGLDATYLLGWREP